MGSLYPLLPPCSPFSTWQQEGSFKNQSDHVIPLLKTFQGPPLTLGIKSKGFPSACGPYTIWPCLFPHLEPLPHLVPALQLRWRFLEPSLTFLTQDLRTCYLLCLGRPFPQHPPVASSSVAPMSPSQSAPHPWSSVPCGPSTLTKPLSSAALSRRVFLGTYVINLINVHIDFLFYCCGPMTQGLSLPWSPLSLSIRACSRHSVNIC